MRIVVLGAGRVGSAITRDLAAHDGVEVVVVDVDRVALDALAGEPALEIREVDVTRPGGVQSAVSGAGLAVGAVPGPLGHATLRAVIDAGVPAVDISFSEESPLPLHELAVERGVVAAVDCGLAPGLSNLVLGHAIAGHAHVSSFSCWVGGLPEVRRPPWEYQSVFSPIDVIAEYTRPARLVEGGRVRTREALSDLELIEVPGIGTLEAFNTDGLRTLLDTVDVPSMREKTLRYPGHADRVRMLRDSGFFSDQVVEIGGQSVRPLDVSARLLAAAWTPAPGEMDVSVLRAEVVAEGKGGRVRETWNLVDRFDPVTGTSSMARTTGYTCAAVARLLAEGLYRTPGITPPELLGRDPTCFSFILEYLAGRGITLAQTVEPAP